MADSSKPYPSDRGNIFMVAGQVIRHPSNDPQYQPYGPNNARFSPDLDTLARRNAGRYIGKRFPPVIQFTDPYVDDTVARGFQGIGILPTPADANTTPFPEFEPASPSPTALVLQTEQLTRHESNVDWPLTTYEDMLYHSQGWQQGRSRGAPSSAGNTVLSAVPNTPTTSLAPNPMTATVVNTPATAMMRGRGLLNAARAVRAGVSGLFGFGDDTTDGTVVASTSDQANALLSETGGNPFGLTSSAPAADQNVNLLSDNPYVDTGSGGTSATAAAPAQSGGILNSFTNAILGKGNLLGKPATGGSSATPLILIAAAGVGLVLVMALRKKKPAAA